MKKEILKLIKFCKIIVKLILTQVHQADKIRIRVRRAYWWRSWATSQMSTTMILYVIYHRYFFVKKPFCLLS
jgi:hypothetical protein